MLSMYTLCWTNNQEEGWERILNKDKLKYRIISLIEEGCSNEDMMVFSPNVDYIVPEENGEI